MNIKNHQQRIIDTVIDRKRTADKSWDDLYSKLLQGDTLDYERIANVITLCNQADSFCLKLGIKICF